MNWIRQEKRLAIYMRDGLSCVWCGMSVEDGVKLTLDHLRAHSKGGSNHESNLVTCCKPCNDSRGSRAPSVFARVVAAYRNHGLTAKEVLSHVRACVLRALDVAGAKEMIARRGSAAKVLAELS